MSHQKSWVLKAEPLYPADSLPPASRGGTWSHLVRRSVLLAAASGRLLVVLAHVHHLSLGALSDQVSAHAGDILKAVAWQGEGRGGRGVGVTSGQSISNKSQSKASQRALGKPTQASRAATRCDWSLEKLLWGKKPRADPDSRGRSQSGRQANIEVDIWSVPKKQLSWKLPSVAQWNSTVSMVNIMSLCQLGDCVPVHCSNMTSYWEWTLNLKPNAYWKDGI